MQGMSNLQISINEEAQEELQKDSLNFKEINNISGIIGHITQMIPSITALEHKLGKIKDGARDETLEGMLKSIKQDSAHLKKHTDESAKTMKGHISKLKSITGDSKIKSKDKELKEISDSESSDSESETSQPLSKIESKKDKTLFKANQDKEIKKLNKEIAKTNKPVDDIIK